MAKEDEKDEGGEGAAKAGGKKNLIMIIVGVLVLVIFSVGGTLMVSKLMHKEEPTKKSAKKKASAKKAEKAEKDGEEEQDGEKQEEGEGEDEGEGEVEDDSVNPDGSKRTATYFDFDQPFVVNFMDEGQMRYLQVTVSVMFLDPKTPEEIKRHMPLIRNNLVMLFSNQTRETIISREGKEKVRTEAEAEVQKVLKKNAGKTLIKSLYFTSFVMQ